MMVRLSTAIKAAIVLGSTSSYYATPPLPSAYVSIIGTRSLQVDPSIILA